MQKILTASDTVTESDSPVYASPLTLMMIKHCQELSGTKLQFMFLRHSDQKQPTTFGAV